MFKSNFKKSVNNAKSTPVTMSPEMAEAKARGENPLEYITLSGECDIFSWDFRGNNLTIKPTGESSYKILGDEQEHGWIPEILEECIEEKNRQVEASTEAELAELWGGDNFKNRPSIGGVADLVINGTERKVSVYANVSPLGKQWAVTLAIKMITEKVEPVIDLM